MRRARGFTLIELLVVLAIISVLVGLGITVIPQFLARGKKTAADSFIKTLDAAIQAYQTQQGAFPPTTLADYVGAGTPNSENQGIESVIVCLNSARYSASFDFADSEGSRLENYDGDQTAAQLTRFGTRDLFEAVDPWDTPYAYFHHRDYDRAEAVGKISGIENVIKCVPYKDPKTKMYKKSDSFQIISAGPDHVFNTEDDVTNFVRD